MTDINGVSLPFLPARGINELRKPDVSKENQSSETSFKDIFEKELNKLNFSAHAKTRMVSRDIKMSNEDYLRLNNAFDKADSKGANESLIIMDDKAFIVNVPNKTVITVVDKSKLSDTVFTNIDSAVIA